MTVKDAQGKETKRATAMFHDFRRSCVRNLENAGTPRKVAKSITGHITDSVYERYHVVNQDDQRAALAKVEAGFRVNQQLNQHKNHENQHKGHGALDSRNASARKMAGSTGLEPATSGLTVQCANQAAPRAR